MQVRHAEKLLLIYSTEALPASEGEIGGAHIHIAFPPSSDPAPPEKTGRRPSVKFAVCETPESMVRQWQKEEDKQILPSNWPPHSKLLCKIGIEYQTLSSLA